MNWKLPASALAASVALAIPLLMFSPVSCGCLDPVQELIMMADLQYSTPEAYTYSAADIEKGLNRSLAGRKVIAGSDYVLFHECDAIGNTKVECQVESARSPLLSKGFNIAVATKPDGTFIKASVRRTWSWR